MDSDDLLAITNLDEQSLLDILRRKYLDSQIYTNSGLFLLSINPYTNVDLYTEEIAELYKKQCVEKKLQPHLYGLLEHCLKDRELYGEHTIIINGDSGAGKTECAKQILKYLGVPALGDADRILESLGNCRTVLNDNSSRFGKLIRLKETVKIETYLLERSRITGYPAGESNFHVFYYILANKKQTLKNDYIDTADISNKAELVLAYENLIGSFSRLLINFEEIENILLGIIYLGSVKFQNGEIIKDKIYSAIVELLNLNESKFDEFLLVKKLKIKSGNEIEEIVKKLTEQESYTLRDSLARHFYENLFYYILGRINAQFEDNPVGISGLNILDIFGFENFSQNGLDQFCINWCNERIHNHFVKNTFESQKNILILEGVDSQRIDEYLNERSMITDAVDIKDINLKNPPSLEMIQKKTGIADLIAEETLINGSAENLAIKLQNHLKLNVRPSNKLRFEHFNGSVEYLLENFVEKNRERCILDPDFFSIFRTPNNNFTSFLHGALTVSKNVIGSFRSNLDHLFGIVNQTRVKYIKCIKPNSNKKPFEFETETVLKQLRSGGILESIKLSKHVFPYSLEISEFIKRYPFMKLDDPCLTKGRSRVFFHSNIFQTLENRKKAYFEQLSTRIKQLVSAVITRKLRAEILLAKGAVKSNDLIIEINEPEVDENAVAIDILGMKNMRKNKQKCMKIIEGLEKQVIKDLSMATSNTLVEENEKLKKIISDLKNELEVINKAKFSAKNFNYKDFYNKYEANCCNPAIQGQNSNLDGTDRSSLINNMPDNVTLYGIFRSFIELFIDNIPQYSEKEHELDSLLCFSQCVYNIMCILIQKGIKDCFEMFMDEMNRHVLAFRDGMPGLVYFLSNFIELRILFKERLTTLQSSWPDETRLVEDQTKIGSFTDLTTETDILKHILSDLDGSIKNLMEHLGFLISEALNDVAPYSVLDHEPLKDINKKQKGIKKWLFSGPSISRLIQYLEYFYGLCIYYWLPPSFTLSVISYALSAVDQMAFNSLLIKGKFLNFDKCYEIKYNLSEIEKFCFNIGFRDGFLNLLHMNEALKIATAVTRLEFFPTCIGKDPASVEDSEYRTAYLTAREIVNNSFLNVSQIKAILSKLDEMLFKELPYDPIKRPFISRPKILSPDINGYSSRSKLAEPSYLPEKYLLKLWQYFCGL